MMRFDDGRVTLYATGLLIAVALTTAVNGATWVAQPSHFARRKIFFSALAGSSRGVRG